MQCASLSTVSFTGPCRRRPSRGPVDVRLGSGCDVRLLSSLRHEPGSWEWAFAPQSPRTEPDVVNLGFVVSHPTPREGADALRRMTARAQGADGHGTPRVEDPLLQGAEQR